MRGIACRYLLRILFLIAGLASSISLFAVASFGQATATLFGWIQDFQVRVGAASEYVTVSANSFMVERATSSVGHVVNQRTVQDIPLNGRYFLDLGLLVPGAVTGPSFNNTDLAITKTVPLGEGKRVQFRTEFFDLFNHANFGQPGNIVGSPNFGRITGTRFPTGESGSSRQLQFAVKLQL